jgi:hypothetical protein
VILIFYKCILVCICLYRLDMVERILDEAAPEEGAELLRMAYRVTLSTVSDMRYRHRLLQLLAKLHVTQKGSLNALDLFNCLIALFDSEVGLSIFLFYYR